MTSDSHVRVVTATSLFDGHMEFFRYLRLLLNEGAGEDIVVHSGGGGTFPRNYEELVWTGVEHRPEAEEECEVLLLEPAGLVNTGDAAADERTAASDRWI